MRRKQCCALIGCINLAPNLFLAQISQKDGWGGHLGWTEPLTGPYMEYHVIVMANSVRPTKSDDTRTNKTSPGIKLNIRLIIWLPGVLKYYRKNHSNMTINQTAVSFHFRNSSVVFRISDGITSGRAVNEKGRHHLTDLTHSSTKLK